MAQVFELAVEPDSSAGVVRFRLADGDGRQLAAHQVQLGAHPGLLWQGLFDTRTYVERYKGLIVADHPATAEDLLDQLGAFLGIQVLGPEVTAVLARGIEQRQLLVQMPEAASDLAVALARVPWELARPAPGEQPLFARNLSVRLLPPGAGEDVLDVVPEGPLRILLVFAEAPGSRPLAMRQEREELLRLFYGELMPKRLAEVEVLCHGVTRRRLRQAVESAGGYDLIHWSGHGHHDLLELLGENGEADLLTGGQLLELLAEAGGFVPRLVFLSACLSGTLTRISSSEELEVALSATASPQPSAASTPTRARDEEAAPSPLAARPGYTGTAFAMLAAGVPLVLAMRYEVGDAYARALAIRFYRHLLADSAHHPADTALALARKDLMASGKGSGAFAAVDHATPLLLGWPRFRVQPRAGRSEALQRARPRPQPLLPGSSRELDRGETFVGRGAELTRLGVEWLGESGPAVALIAGLGGLGKTSLAAEAVNLWHRRFDWVFAFQSKPTPLAVESFYAQLDSKLALESATYRNLCETRPNSSILLPEKGQVTGQARYERMRQNLFEALRDEAVLLVLDNFETCLETVKSEGGYRTADPEWDRLLRHLAGRLPDTPSRLLITSRHRLAAIATAGSATVLPLGPLPLGEAVHLLQQDPALMQLATGDESGKRLARRLLEVSRGHPLILSRLAALAKDRAALAHALDTLAAQGVSALPDLFATAATPDERERERAYLEDVAQLSIDLLLARATPPARHLLWLVTHASEPVSEEMIAGVASRRSVEEEQLYQLRNLLAAADGLPHEIRDRLASMPTELRNQVDSLAPVQEIPPGPLLAELVEAGLLTVEDQGGIAFYQFHELVRERTAQWMTNHPEEPLGRTDAEVWTAYGERYANAFKHHLTSGEAGARDQATEVGQRALAYLVRARAFEGLRSFASRLVTSTKDPSQLRTIITNLAGVADQLPQGVARWSVRTNLADALRESGRPDQSLALYEEAAAEAEAAGNWGDVGWICQNWANALANIGDQDEAKRKYERSAGAKRRAGSPEADVLGSELEVLRIEIYQGNSKSAMPEVEQRLLKVRSWWQRRQSGEAVPEAGDVVMLGRVLIGALDIAEDANRALGRWQACLELLTEIEETERVLGEGELTLAITRFNRYGPLLKLGYLDDAQYLVEGCLDVFRQAESPVRQARALSALGNIWRARGNSEQAESFERQALAVRNRLPDPFERAISHNNLAIDLDQSGNPEAACHRLAALAYFIVSSHKQKVNDWRDYHRVLMQGAAAAGGNYELPLISDLLARPAFEPLKRFLDDRRTDLEKLQRVIDDQIAQAQATPH